METEYQVVENGTAIPCKLDLPVSGTVRRIVLGVHGLGGSTEDAIQRSLADAASDRLH